MDRGKCAIEDARVFLGGHGFGQTCIEMPENWDVLPAHGVPCHEMLGFSITVRKKNAYSTSSKIHQGCHCFYCFLIRFSIAALFQKFKTGTTDILGMPYLLQNFFGPNFRIRDSPMAHGLQ
jgi:hypothetical protein